MEFEILHKPMIKKADKAPTSYASKVIKGDI